MTIQQLQYVSEIARTGSVSKAAKNLYLSQPNISNAVKKLEVELGITIFERTPMGMSLTPAGRKLVQKASSIIKDIEDITNTVQQEEKNTFQLIYPRYVPAFEAFWEMCRRHEKENQLHFSSYNGEGLQPVEELYKGTCDLAIYLRIETPAHFDRFCRDLHVEYVELKKIGYHVQLAEGHPLLQEEPFAFEKLKQYPYVAFTDTKGSDANWMPWADWINPDKLICVQSMFSRVFTVANSQAFSIVLPHSPEYNKKHHVVQIPFGEKNISMGYLYSRERGLTLLAEEYLELLKKKLELL